MKALALCHVDFEKPAMIGKWLQEKGYSLEIIKVEDKIEEYFEYDYDVLVVMGGPMNIYEYDKYPWLRREKEFIKKGIDSGKKVIGICLGAQLISDVMGGKIDRNPEVEIGWFEITRTESEESILEGTPTKLHVLHWHGDRFSIPPQATRIYESQACTNQGFVYDNRVLGLQFHMEMEEENIKSILKNCADELVDGKWIQEINEIELFTEMYIDRAKEALYTILENMIY